MDEQSDDDSEDLNALLGECQVRVLLLKARADEAEARADEAEARADEAEARAAALIALADEAEEAASHRWIGA